MFVIVQLPFADLRSMVPGEMGRLTLPDWTADEPSPIFVRGFGKMATRNSKGFGLFGERAFADFNNAVRFPETLMYGQQEWRGKVQFELRFRRLYFDGKLAGRFEYGFIGDRGAEERVARFAENCSYDIGKLTDAILEISVIISSPDGQYTLATVGTCAEALGRAYLMATTKQSALSEFLPAEIYGKAVALGHPFIHVRVSNDMAAKESRDRREIEGGEGKLFVTSNARSSIRNNVLVQMSQRDVLDESPGERAIRVLFSHMNALLFAEAHFLRTKENLKLGPRSALRDAVRDMLTRFERLGPTGPAAENDKEFAAAIKLFADAYTGRSDELAAKIEDVAIELAKPSAARRIGAAIKNGGQWLAELVVKTGVEAAVKS